MSEPKAEYKTKRGKGRPSNGDYPEKLFARVTKEQLEHVKNKYGDISKGIRTLIDADMGVIPGKMIVTIPAATQTAMQQPRIPAGDDGDGLPY